MAKDLFKNEKRSKVKLTNDFVFHYIYGKDTENSKKALIGLLNLILERDFDPITSVTIKNPINYREYEVEKEIIMDIKAQTNSGILMDIEMQASHYTAFDKRCVYNASQLIKDSLQAGNNYDNMTTSIVISIVEDKIFKDEMNLHSKFCYMEIDLHRILTDVSQIHLLELGRLDIDKPIEEMSKEEKLCMYIRYACDEKYTDYIEKILDELEELAMTEVVLNELTRDEYALEMARRRDMYRQDKEIALEHAKREGRTEGILEGENKMAMLNQKLIALNRFDDLKKATMNKEFREELYKEFDIV